MNMIACIFTEASIFWFEIFFINELFEKVFILRIATLCLVFCTASNRQGEDLPLTKRVRGDAYVGIYG